MIIGFSLIEILHKENPVLITGGIQGWICSVLLLSTDQLFKPFVKFSPHLTVGRTTQHRPVRQELSLILDAK